MTRPKYFCLSKYILLAVYNWLIRLNCRKNWILLTQFTHIFSWNSLIHDPVLTLSFRYGIYLSTFPVYYSVIVKSKTNYNHYIIFGVYLHNITTSYNIICSCLKVLQAVFLILAKCCKWRIYRTVNRLQFFCKPQKKPLYCFI